MVTSSELVVFGVFPGVPVDVGLDTVELTPCLVDSVEGDVLPVDVTLLPVVVGFEPGVPVVTGVVIVPDTKTVGFSVVSVVSDVVSVVVSIVVAVVVTVTKQPKILTLTFKMFGLVVLRVMVTPSTGLSCKSVIGLFFGAFGLLSTTVPLYVVVTVKVTWVGVSTWITPTRPTVSGLNGITILTSLVGKVTPLSLNKPVLSRTGIEVTTSSTSTSSG